jgi:hypothetical protein
MSKVQALNGAPGIVLESSLRYADALMYLLILRNEIRNWRSGPQNDVGINEVDEILWAFQELATAARGGGFHAFACVCCDLAEQVDELSYRKRIPRATQRRLSEWADAAVRYLRHPFEADAAAAVIENISHPHWGAAFAETEVFTLFRSLLNPSI